VQSQLTEQQTREGLERLGPFHHRVELPYGLSTHDESQKRRSIELTRVSSLVDHAFPPLLRAVGGSLAGKRVLDVACNCGGFSVAATEHGCESVVGVDIVDHYIEQANFIKDAAGLDNAEFKVLDVNDISESTVGMFDVTLCFGLMYHLENPVLSMKRIASVTKEHMLIDTAVLPTPKGNPKFTSRPLWMMNFPTVAGDDKHHTTSGWRADERPIQFAPTVNAVIELMKNLGFSKVDKIEPTNPDIETRYYKGRRASFLASR